MADNVLYQLPGSGVTVGTDEVTINSILVHLQRMKVSLGGDGTYQGDLSFGPKIAASSIPVTLPTDQTVPTSIGSKATYMVSSSGTLTIAQAGVETSMAYLWHPSSSTKKAILQKILVSWIATSGSGEFRLALSRITAEAGSPGGSTPNILKQDQDDAAATATFRQVPTGIPTRQAGDYINLIFNVNSNNQINLLDIPAARGFVCRASQSEGWELRGITAVSTNGSPNFALTFVWTEE